LRVQGGSKSNDIYGDGAANVVTGCFHPALSLGSAGVTVAVMTAVRRPGVVGNELIRDLGCLNAQLLAVVGGKAGNLGELIRAGFPVPARFCLTTAAYQQVAANAFDAGAPAGSRPRS
jgi:hypothetical protein